MNPTPSESLPVLELRGVRCERDDRVLFEHLDLRLAAGAAVQLRGANGTGKTTLLRCIAGLHPDHDGEIRIRAGGPGAGMLFIGHRPGVSASLTAAENLGWYQQLSGFRRDARSPVGGPGPGSGWPAG
ncbi:MAG: ATP-binding cassette domain-containing protein [Gammaproteobacteria bacterium]|nr:ATP-binding cassette domain-containing protein [Gammaproteobacteria bacterium]